jgi:hypothetical protein
MTERGFIRTSRPDRHAHPMMITPVVRRVLVPVVSATLVVLAATAAPSAIAHPVPHKPLETVTVHSNGHTYVLKVWAKQRSKNCRAHAYGHAVRHFLATHKCKHLTRYLVTTKVNGRGVGFAQSAVEIPGTKSDPYGNAGKFHKLVDKNGTGNFDSLFQDGYHTPKGPQSVPDPDAFRIDSQDTGVTIVDAWYLHGSTPQNAKPLVHMAKRIYLQWF